MGNHSGHHLSRRIGGGARAATAARRAAPSLISPLDALVARNGYRDKDMVKAQAATLDQAYATTAGGVTTAQRQAIAYYQGVNFERVNQSLRSGVVVNSVFQRRVIDQIDAAIHTMRAPRAVTGYFARQTQISPEQAQVMVGKTVSFGSGYRSLTLDPLYPLTNFTGRGVVQGQRVLYEVTVPKGGRGAWLGALGSVWRPMGKEYWQRGNANEPRLPAIQGRSNERTANGRYTYLGWEHEMLLARNARFHVDRVYTRQVNLYSDTGDVNNDHPEFPPVPVTVVSGHLVN